jgi:VWFA-related protein
MGMTAFPKMYQESKRQASPLLFRLTPPESLSMVKYGTVTKNLSMFGIIRGESMTDDPFLAITAQLASENADERREAVLASLNTRDPRIIDLLVGVVQKDQNPDVRYQARRAFYLLRDIIPENPAEPFLDLPDGIAYDDLEKLLQDYNPRLRREGIKLTERMDPGTILPLFRRLLPKEAHQPHIHSMIGTVGKMGNANDIPLLAGFLQHGVPDLRIAAVEALAKIGGNDAHEVIVPLLRDTDAKVRTTTTRALQSLDTNEFMKILRNLAGSPTEANRDVAIFVLQRYKIGAAAKIIAHMSINDPLPAMREKALEALKAMAKANETAREILEKMEDPTDKEDENAPAMIPAEELEEPVKPPAPVKPSGSAPPNVPTQPTQQAQPTEPAQSAQPSQAQSAAASTPPPRRKTLVAVPGVTRKLDKEISASDPVLRESGLRQLASFLKPEHHSYLLYRLNREEDPRLTSFLLSLIGRTRAESTYAAVIKRFKHPDNRVRANAIEAAMAIDPLTTPDRISGFLSDPNNRVVANCVLAWVNRPNFDPLVWTQGLASHRDPAYRRSALHIIARLQLPTFLTILENLVFDDDMEIRHLAFVQVKKFETAKVKGAAALAEKAAPFISKEMKGAGNLNQDFHAAMIAMRSSAPKQRVIPKATKSTTEEFGEQLLGKDGLKQAGTQMKHLKEQAKMARETVSARLADTKASLTASSRTGTLLRRGGCAALVLLILVIVYIFATRPGSDSPAPLDPVETATGSASAVISTEPGHDKPVTNTATTPAAPPTESAAPVKLTAAIQVLEPHKNAVVSGPFLIKAAIKGKMKAADIFIGETRLKHFDRPTSGTIEAAVEAAQIPRPGRHTIKIRGTDANGHPVSAFTTIEIPAPLADITIISPASGAVFWRDDRFAVTVTGEPHTQVLFRLDDTMLGGYPATPEGRYELAVPMGAYPVGPHLFEVGVTMADGRQATAAAAFTVAIPQPRIAFQAPQKGQQVFGVVPIELEVDSGFRETPIRQVTWSLDGLQKSRLGSPPWQFSWDTQDIPPGPCELSALVENEIGRTASAALSVEVIKPAFSAQIKGLSNNQILREDTTGTVAVTNEITGTTIKKITVNVDDVLLAECTPPRFNFTIRINDFPAGPRKLTAEAVRSDGQTCAASLKFSVDPPGRRTTYVAVRNADGKVVSATDLAKIRLHIRENGTDVGSYTLEPATAGPLWIGLAVDTSGSMRADQKLAKTKQALSAFLDTMRPGDRACLIRFADTPELVLGYTDDRTKLLQEIEFFSAKGGSFALDAVLKAVEVANSAPARTFLILLTDGDTTAGDAGHPGRRTAADVLEAARRQDMQCYPISIGGQSGTPGPGTAGLDTEAALRELAILSKGRFMTAATAAELPTLVPSIMQEIQSHVRLSYQSPAGAPDGKWHTIEITAPGHDNLVIQYKPGYRARIPAP